MNELLSSVNFDQLLLVGVGTLIGLLINVSRTLLDRALTFVSNTETDIDDKIVLEIIDKAEKKEIITTRAAKKVRDELK